ncbi:MAG TPA: symmetrical bis(5'-nucleosyl)-tetraphosphatase [Woeseiaceae bacterium]|nr:symmetrical bis(5'-nucleosyl)-tetraphosphatase [Woeseiaceae bacterium]
MAVYAIGDVQGCYDPLRRLLDRLEFDPGHDRLWLTGDLVNRGPQSLEVLRFVRGLGRVVTTVLGNHDLHLIALAAGIDGGRDPDATLAPVLAAPDRDELVTWLRKRPLAHYDEKLNTLLVHAGLPAEWTVKKTLKRAAEVEEVLRGDAWLEFLPALYGNTPARWSGKLEGHKRLRYIVNALTRVRMLDEEGRLDFSHKGPPTDAKKGLVPWFDAPDARWRGTRIVFGHWSALGLMIRPDLIGLDTGCVWNRELTAVRLNGRPKVVQVDCACT